jgi:hypothetical protein
MEEIKWTAQELVDMANDVDLVLSIDQARDILEDVNDQVYDLLIDKIGSIALSK